MTRTPGPPSRPPVEPPPPQPVRGRWQTVDTALPPCPACGAPQGGVFVTVVGRLAHLMSYLASRARLWDLDSHKGGTLHLAYALNEHTGNDDLRCWREIREDIDLGPGPATAHHQGGPRP